jgi:hypothetical protein
VLVGGPLLRERLLPGALDVREDVDAEVLQVALGVLARWDRPSARRLDLAAERRVYVERGAAATTAEHLDEQEDDDPGQAQTAGHADTRAAGDAHARAASLIEDIR